MNKTTIDSGLASIQGILDELESSAAKNAKTEDYDLRELAKSDLRFVNGLQVAIKEYIKESYNCFDDLKPEVDELLEL